MWDQTSAACRCIHAVASSCAVPMLFPAVTIEGRRYMDGGLLSSLNAAAAPPTDVLVVLSVPRPRVPGRWCRRRGLATSVTPDDELAPFRADETAGSGRARFQRPRSSGEHDGPETRHPGSPDRQAAGGRRGRNDPGRLEPLKAWIDVAPTLSPKGGTSSTRAKNRRGPGSVRTLRSGRPHELAPPRLGADPAPRGSGVALIGIETEPSLKLTRARRWPARLARSIGTVPPRRAATKRSVPSTSPFSANRTMVVLRLCGSIPTYCPIGASSLSRFFYKTEHARISTRAEAPPLHRSGRWRICAPAPSARRIPIRVATS